LWKREIVKKKETYLNGNGWIRYWKRGKWPIKKLLRKQLRKLQNWYSLISIRYLKKIEIYQDFHQSIYYCKNWTLSDRLLGQEVLQWMKSFVGIGSLWKLDWSNNWLISWLIDLLTDHPTTEGGRALIPILIIRELRLFDVIGEWLPN
jgi:hypothetical protein